MAVIDKPLTVVAGNGVLEAYAKRFVQRTVAAPTPINVAAVPVKQANEGDVIRIGWTGTPDNINYLEAHAAAFRELLLDIHSLALKKQGEKVADTLDNWKGRGMQVDDILVVGFKYHFAND